MIKMPEPTGYYQEWPCFDQMPDGWRIDRNAGSPLHGYEYIISGSPLKGGKRALLRVHRVALQVVTPPATQQPEPEPKPKQIIDENYMHMVNELARKKFELRLLADIRVDLMVCEIEGWDKREYLEELKRLITELGKINA